MSDMQLLAAVFGGSASVLFVAGIFWLLEKREDRLDQQAWNATYGVSR